MRRALRCAVVAGLAALSVWAGSQSQKLSSVPQRAFETASIRPARESPACFSMLPPGGTQYAATCVSLLFLIEGAYNTNYVEGGGKALDSEPTPKLIDLLNWWS